MPLNLEEIEGYAEVMQKIHDQAQRIEALERRLAFSLQQPKERWTTYEANTLFIGRKRKPVDRHTFTKMVNNWLAKGELIPEVNYWVNGNVKFISTDFLKGQLPAAERKKMKRA